MREDNLQCNLTFGFSGSILPQGGRDSFLNPGALNCFEKEVELNGIVCQYQTKEM